MYTGTTTEFNSIISENSRHFFCKLVYKNEELTKFRSVKLTQQSIPDTDSFTIGGTISSIVEVEMDKPKTLITGKEFQMFLGLEVAGEVEWCPMCVVTAEKPKEDSGIITFTAYDRMVTVFNFPYYTDIKNYPVDAKEILKEISSKTGVPIANIDSLSEGMMIHQIVKENETTGENVTVNPFAGYSYRETIKYIAQLYGTFATMNRNGELEFRWYKKTDYTVRKNRSYDDLVLNEEEYEVQRIVCASAKIAVPGMDGGMILYVLHGPVQNRDGIITAGTGPTGITLENPVMEVTLMEKLWAKIKGFKFIPATVSFLGDCRLDLGDIVTVETQTEEIELPIMSISYEFDGGLTTEVGSYGSTEMQEASANASPMDRMVSYVNSEILQVKELVANKVSTEYLEANYATIKQLNAVEAKIDEITATDITVEYLKAHYAQIDMANVDVANIRQGFLENLMVSQGIVADRIVGTEVVATKALTGINIYADDITAGTLSVDRLVLRGTEKSLVYALNNSGELVSTQVDTLDAYILTERTITADKIVAESITANEIAASAITAEKIATNAVTSAKIEAGAVTADKITVDSLEAIVAKIGDFTINSKAIYKGTNSKSSTTAGVYLGTDAIRAYQSENAYTHIENGILSCCGANIKGEVYCDSGIYLKIPAGYFGSEAEYYEKIISVPNEYTLLFGNKTKGSYLYFCYGNTASSEGFGLIWKDITIASYTGDGIITSGINWFSSNVNFENTITCTSAYASNWFRSTGKTGWYNQTYGGGWYMTDSSWIRTYGGKSVYVDQSIRVAGEFQTTNPNNYRMVQGGKSIFWRNDGSTLYLLLSDSEYGGYNSLRPFSVNLTNGGVSLGNGCSVNGKVYANGTIQGDSGVYWGSQRCIFGKNNTILWLNNPGGNYMEVNCNNGTTYGVTWFVSDARLKKDIEETSVTALDYIKKIEHKQFGWLDEERREVRCGYVAQQLEEVGLDVVYRIKQSEDSQLDELYQIDGTRLLPYMTKAIQELSTQIEELKKQIATMQQGAV